MRYYLLILVVSLLVGVLPTSAEPLAVEGPIDAKIEIVWPHDAQGHPAPVDQAPLANVRVYLFEGDTLHPYCQEVEPASLTLLSAKNNEPVWFRLRASGAQPVTVTQGDISFRAYDFNDVDVSAANDPGNRISFTVLERVRLSRTEGVRAAPTIDVDARTNVWTHAVNALTLLPTMDAPTGTSPAPFSGAARVNDPRIEIVWPHGNAPASQADKVNVTAMIFHAGTLTAMSPDYDRPLYLDRALNQAPFERLGVGTKRLVTANGMTYPVWDFNDIDVSAAKDPRNKYFFHVETDYYNRSNIWVHGADGRTFFPTPDVPDRGCP